MDQQIITGLVVVCLFIVGAAVLLATINFGPNMKDYFDRK
jgi:hypothetical protein